MEIEIRRLLHSDNDNFKSLIMLFEEVFEWERTSLPGMQHLQKVLGNPDFLAFVASVEKQIVGGLTAYVLEKYDSEKPSAYLYDLAVLPPFQRKGIGKLLITTLNDYCLDHGFEEMFVQADINDLYAIDFYRKTAVTDELQAIHFTYSFGNK